MVRHRKAEVEEADGNSSRKELVSHSLFMELNNLEVRGELFTMATQAWAEVTWIGKWPTEQKEAWRKQILEVQT